MITSLRRAVRVYFYQQNSIGSVTRLTSFQGAVIEEYSYDEFGAPTTTYTQGNFNNRFKVTARAEWGRARAVGFARDDMLT